MHTAKFPVHRDLAGFDFDVSPVDRKLIHQLAMTFTDAAHNAVMAAGTGKTHPTRPLAWLASPLRGGG
jgi:hypothetical protein